MLIQYSPYPTGHNCDRPSQFSHFSKKKSKHIYWLFQRVTNDTSFGYFHVWEKFGIKRVNYSGNTLQ